MKDDIPRCRECKGTTKVLFRDVSGKPYIEDCKLCTSPKPLSTDTSRRERIATVMMAALTPLMQKAIWNGADRDQALIDLPKQAIQYADELIKQLDGDDD